MKFALASLIVASASAFAPSATVNVSPNRVIVERDLFVCVLRLWVWNGIYVSFGTRDMGMDIDCARSGVSAHCTILCVTGTNQGCRFEPI